MSCVQITGADTEKCRQFNSLSETLTILTNSSATLDSESEGKITYSSHQQHGEFRHGLRFSSGIDIAGLKVFPVSILNIGGFGKTQMHPFLKLTAIAAVLSFVPTSHAVVIPGSYTIGGSTTGTGPWTMLGLGQVYGVLSFNLNSPIAFQNLTDLNYGYDSILGGISHGSPRAVFILDYNNDSFEDLSFAIRWGPAAPFVDPTIGNNLNTGNLLALNDMGRYDLSGLGTPFSSFHDRATALLAVGNVNVLRIALVIEGDGGGSNPRLFQINSVNVNGNAAPTPAPDAGSTLIFLGFAMAGLMSIRRFIGLARPV